MTPEQKAVADLIERHRQDEKPSTPECWCYRVAKAARVLEYAEGDQHG
jgi:hypothetical protein